MPLRIFGNGGGLCSEGDETSICPPHFGLFSHSDRPYLYVYKHSSEIEEVTVIGLDGVNIESNPEMELLLGVSRGNVALPFAAYTILTYLKRNRSRSRSLPPQTHTHLRRPISGSCVHGQLNWIPHVCRLNCIVSVAD